MKETIASELVFGDYGLTFANPYPERAGQIRAREREDKERKKKKKSHPPVETMTRQRRRQNDRKQFKKLRSMAKIKDQKKLKIIDEA